MEAEMKYPVKVLKVSGRLPEDQHKVIPLGEALGRHLRVEGGELYLNVVGPRSFLDFKRVEPVSYTHLTLPTSDLV